MYTSYIYMYKYLYKCLYLRARRPRHVHEPLRRPTPAISIYYHRTHGVQNRVRHLHKRKNVGRSYASQARR